MLVTAAHADLLRCGRALRRDGVERIDEENELVATEPDSIVRVEQLRRSKPDAVHADTVATPEIRQQAAFIADEDLGVLSGHERIVERDRTLGSTAEERAPGP